MTAPTDDERLAARRARQRNYRRGARARRASQIDVPGMVNPELSCGMEEEIPTPTPPTESSEPESTIAVALRSGWYSSIVGGKTIAPSIAAPPDPEDDG